MEFGTVSQCPEPAFDSISTNHGAAADSV